MLPIIQGYRLTHTLYESDHSIIYRGWRDADLLPVILKQFRPVTRLPDETVRFKHEYELTRRLHSKHVIQAYALVHDEGRLLMILEDIGGESLRGLRLAGMLSPGDLLTLAIEVCEGLDDLHRQHVIHKDVNPSNIILNQTTGQLRIIDFGIASQFAKEYASFRNSTVIEGTLAYISPEQTGRMNRDIDFRTDFYSLGATLYELLTGRLPFDSKDALTLVHAHIARMPVPPHEYIILDGKTASERKALRVFSDIVIKLLAKNAEDRYQSSQGILHDLFYCRDMLVNGGEPDSVPFIVGRHDLSGRFSIPQKLYGRAQHVAALLEAFERVASGATVLIAMTGEAGIGKSSVIHEIHKPITAKRGYFLAGKFDEFRRNIAYSAISQAFDRLCDDILAESAEEFAVWRQRIADAVGENGQVLLDVIPQLAEIIGRQPPIPAVGLQETEQRFLRTFQQLLRALCHRDHPIVFFLDDLQWADTASLHLLQSLLTDPDVQALLIIVAYREHEVTEGHPLHLRMTALAQAGVAIEEMRLTPLGVDDVAALVRETLSADAPQLSELIFAKTQGNPLFVRQFFQMLSDSGMVSFDPIAQQWAYDMPRLRALPLADNVALLLTQRIERLPQRIRQSVQIASCLGYRFDLATLAALCHEPEEKLLLDMVAASDEGFIIAFEPGANWTQRWYQFAHDRLRETAYAMIADTEKPGIHLQIARLLQHALSDKEREERLFELVEHWNAAANLLSDLSEKRLVAEFNLEAGKKAKASAAHQAAIVYFSAGIAMTTPQDWESRRAMMLAFYDELAEAAYLASDYAVMRHAISVVRDHAQHVLDTIRARETEILANMAQGKIAEAVEIGLTTLQELGVKFPQQPGHDDFAAYYGAIKAAMAGRHPMELTTLPPMTDPKALAALRLLVATYAPVFFSRPELIPFIIMKQVALSLQYGHSPLSPLGYAIYGLLLCGPLQEYETGYQFGQLAAECVSDPASASIRTHTTQMIAFAILPWHTSLHACIAMLRDNYEAGMALGDVMYAMYSANTYLFYAYYAGLPLDMLLAECQTFLRAVETQPYVLERMKFVTTMIACMSGNLAEHGRSARDLFAERMSVASFEASHDAGMQHLFYLNKLYLALLFDQPEESLHYADIVPQFLPASVGIYVYSLFFFYDALAQAAAYHLFEAQQQQLARERMAGHLQQLARWAELCPANFAHKQALVQAELSRIEGRFEETLDAYDEAIRLAKIAGFLNEEALANECAAKFWLSKGKQQLASIYLHNARTCYQLWGANPKAAQLESVYPEIFLKLPSALRPFKTDTSSSSRRIETLDLAAMMKAAQTISKELSLPELAKELMIVTLETAGAERVSLLLRERGTFMLYAQCDATAQVEIVSEPLSQTNRLPRNLLEYMIRKREPVIVENVSSDFRFMHDPSIAHRAVKSALSLPILHGGNLIGALYFENNVTEGAFGSDRVDILRLLAGQAAVSLENARIYARIEQSVQERTAELHALNVSLRKEIAERQHVQTALQESQELFSTFMDYLPALAFITNADGHIIYANASFERHMGSGWQNKTVRDMLPDDLAQIMEEDNQKVLEHGMVERIEQVPTMTEGIRTYQTIKFRIERSGNAPRIGGLAIDVTALKQTEEALRESQRLLLMIADNIPAYIAYVDMKSLKYQFVNKQFQQFGLPREQIINKHIREIIGERNYEFALPYIEQVKAGRRASYENVFPQPTGKVWAQVNYVPAIDEQGDVRGIVVLTHDITQIKQTEEALRESRNLLLTIADNLPAYIAYVDADTLCYKFLNKQFENFGRPCSELIGKKICEVIGEANYALAFPYLEKARTGEPTVYENEFRLIHGQRLVQVNYVPEFDDGGRVRGIVVLGNDITMQKQTEQALRESEKLLLLIADNMPAYIAYVNAADLRYRFVNKRYEDFGCSRQEIIGKTFLDLVGESSYRFAKPYLDQVLSGQPAFYENILRFSRGERWIKVNYVPDIDEEQHVRGIVILSYDITQEKQTAEALKLAKESAESANQAKSMFLASMSHELRTPLNAIIGFSQLLINYASLPLEVRDYVEIIQRSSTHLLTLINQVLDLSKIEADRMTLNEKPMNLYALLDELEEMFWLKAEQKGLRLVFERDEDLPCGILADELKLRQILINLLNNAIKFTSRGEVIVRVTRLPIMPSDHVLDSQVVSAKLQFLVEDTGAGIAPEDAEAVFVPFLQTEVGRKTQDGTGLGLPISRKFLQLMGGDLQLHSEVGRGSTFTFTISTRLIDNMENVYAPRPRRVIGLAPNQPCYKILIVDDHEESRALLRCLLAPLGFDIEEAQDGPTAFEAWQRWQPDMIWLDICLPVMSGNDTARCIRDSEQATGRHVCIIATSAASGQDEQATALASGCDDFLRKPLRDTDIFDRLQGFLHVQFRYAEEGKMATPLSIILSPAMIREAIAALPLDVQEGLKQAMVTADIAKITELAEKIAYWNEPLRDAILERIKQFDYQTFLEAFHVFE